MTQAQNFEKSFNKKFTRKKGQWRGREVDPQSLKEVRQLLGKESRQRDLLIEYLHKIQDFYHYISASHLIALAQEMNLAHSEVYEVATFYHHFDVITEAQTAPPELTIRVCESISCEMQGAKKLLTQLQQIKTKNTGLQNIRIQRVPCVGHCDKAPIAVIGKHVIAKANTDNIKQAVKNKQIKAHPLLNYINYQDYKNLGGYQLLSSCHNQQLSTSTILQQLEKANLRGLGGAGFPTAKKWKILCEQKKPCLVAINIDEGEPGTMKDRYYLERDPHRFMEGALIAAWVIGASAVYIYLRDEYASCHLMLEKEILALQQNPPCPLVPIFLRRGAGSYICGEESAMIESLQGNKGIPRMRPPYLAEKGLFNLPTLEQNMETMHWVRDIIASKGEYFTNHGYSGCIGLRSFSISGRVNKPGIYLAPAGISLLQLLDEYCGGMQKGHELYGYFPGGASGGILPAKLADIPLDFDTLSEYGCFIGSAAIIVFSQQDSVRELALNAMTFFSNESCGKCTPCREGTHQAAALMQKDNWDIPLLKELSELMMDASICGLGQAAPNPLLCAIKYFPQEFKTV